MFCFGRFCIICINNQENLINLDVNVVISDEDFSLLQVLLKINAELPNIDEIIPKYICVSCKKDLITTYIFQKKCRKSIEILHNYIYKLNNTRRPLFNTKNVQNKSFTFGYNAVTSRHMLFKIKKLSKHNFKKSKNTKFNALSLTSSNFSDCININDNSISDDDKSTVILERTNNFRLSNTIEKLAKYLNVTDLAQLEQNNLDLRKLEQNILDPKILDHSVDGDTTAIDDPDDSDDLEDPEDQLNPKEILDLDQKFNEVFNLMDDYFVKEENALDLGSCDSFDISSNSIIDVKKDVKTESTNNNYIDLISSPFGSKNIRSTDIRTDAFIDLTDSPSNTIPSMGSNLWVIDTKPDLKGLFDEGSNNQTSDLDLNRSIDLEIKQDLLDCILEPNQSNIKTPNKEIINNYSDDLKTELEIVEHPITLDPDGMLEIKIEIQEMLAKHAKEEAEEGLKNKRKLDLQKNQNSPKKCKYTNAIKEVPDLVSFSSKIIENVQKVNSPPNDPNIHKYVNYSEPNDPNKIRDSKSISPIRKKCDIILPSTTNIKDPNLGSRNDPKTPKSVFEEIQIYKKTKDFKGTNILNEKVPKTTNIKDPNSGSGNDPKTPKTVFEEIQVYKKTKDCKGTNILNEKDPKTTNIKDPNLGSGNDPKIPNTVQIYNKTKECKGTNILNEKDPNTKMCHDITNIEDPNLGSENDLKTPKTVFEEIQIYKKIKINILNEKGPKTKICHDTSNIKDPNLGSGNDPQTPKTIFGEIQLYKKTKESKGTNILNEKDPNVLDPKTKMCHLDPYDPKLTSDVIVLISPSIMDLKETSPNTNDPKDSKLTGPNDPNATKLPAARKIDFDVLPNDPKDQNLGHTDPQTKDNPGLNSNNEKSVSSDKDPNSKSNDPNSKSNDPNIISPDRNYYISTSPSTSQIPIINSSPRRCKYCKTIYETGLELKCHIFSRHKELFNECPRCLKTFANSYFFQKHLENCAHPELEGNQFRKFNNQQMRSPHNSRNYFRNNGPRPFRPDQFRGRGPQNQFNCEHCRKVCYTLFKFKRHMYLDHNIR